MTHFFFSSLKWGTSPATVAALICWQDAVTEDPGAAWTRCRVQDQESAEAHLSPVTSVWEHPYYVWPWYAHLCNGADRISLSLPQRTVVKRNTIK